MITKLFAILCGVALTWTCAACGLFLLTGHGCRLVASKDSLAIWQVHDVAEAISAYSTARGRCPATTDDLIVDGYLRAPSLVDPWGTSIAAWCSDDAMNVISAGPDRTFGTADDVTSAR